MKRDVGAQNRGFIDIAQEVEIGETGFRFRNFADRRLQLNWSSFARLNPDLMPFGLFDTDYRPLLSSKTA